MMSMIKADGHLPVLFERPIAAGLGVVTLTIWTLPILFTLYRWLRGRALTAS